MMDGGKEENITLAHTKYALSSPHRLVSCVLHCLPQHLSMQE